MKTCGEVFGERISDVVTLDWILWTQLVVSLSWFFASTSSLGSDFYIKKSDSMWWVVWFRIWAKSLAVWWRISAESILCLSSSARYEINQFEIGVWHASAVLRVRSKCMIWHVSRLVMSAKECREKEVVIIANWFSGILEWMLCSGRARLERVFSIPEIMMKVVSLVWCCENISREHFTKGIFLWVVNVANRCELASSTSKSVFEMPVQYACSRCSCRWMWTL